LSSFRSVRVKQKVGSTDKMKQDTSDNLVSKQLNQKIKNLSHSNLRFYFGNIQTKLKVSKPDDIYEKEPDKIAEQIVGMNYTYTNATMSNENKGREILNRKCLTCEEEKDEDKEEEQIQISRKNNMDNSQKFEVSNAAGRMR
jgi:hypothetical protein